MYLEGKPEQQPMSQKKRKTEQQPLFSYALAILWQDKLVVRLAHQSLVKISQTQFLIGLGNGTALLRAYKIQNKTFIPKDYHIKAILFACAINNLTISDLLVVQPNNKQIP
jgi:hypothetical protein